MTPLRRIDPNDRTRLRDLEVGHARHDEQIRDHDGVLRDLKDHMGQVVAEIADLKYKALIAIALLAGSKPAAAAVTALFG